MWTMLHCTCFEVVYCLASVSMQQSQHAVDWYHNRLLHFTCMFLKANPFSARFPVTCADFFKSLFGYNAFLQSLLHIVCWLGHSVYKWCELSFWEKGLYKSKMLFQWNILMSIYYYNGYVSLSDGVNYPIPLHSQTFVWRICLKMAAVTLDKFQSFFLLQHLMSCSSLA